MPTWPNEQASMAPPALTTGQASLSSAFSITAGGRLADPVRITRSEEVS